MSAHTKIEWCDATVNWWAGCTAVSPACDNCYAKRMAGRLWGTEWGTGKPRHQFAGAVAALQALDRKAKRMGQTLRVFHNSLSDFFDNEVSQEWRDQAFQAMADTPNLVHLLLTKRIGNVAGMLPPLVNTFDKVFPNVWIGATVVNQAEADRDIPKLLAVPAAKRFLSMEPLLGPVDLNVIQHTAGYGCGPCAGCGSAVYIDALNGSSFCAESCDGPMWPAIDWVIAGGESGPNARPMHPDWVRSLRDQCQAAGVAFMFKQWGEWIPSTQHCAAREANGYAPIREFYMDRSGRQHRIGKKAAGRLLDGREWNGVPA